MLPVTGIRVSEIYDDEDCRFGIYYEPGSAMARLCVEGARRMYDYCGKKNLPHERVGKLIVATRDSELPILEDLYKRATANGVPGIELISSKKVQEMEPNVRALQALHSPNTGITDYAKVGRSFAEDLLSTGRGQIRTRSVLFTFCLAYPWS
jgi:L-2-hydroxyglutarate oxidase LhgO